MRVALVLVTVFFMAESSERPSGGVARRRRERRMRSWFRHEQQSIRMALATVLHHSYDKVHTEYGAPRSQNTATRARGGREVDEMKYTAKFRKTPPPQAFFVRRGRRRVGVAAGLSGRAAWAAGAGPAAHRGAHRRRGAHGPDSRCSCASGGRTGGGPACGGVPAPRLAHSRAGYRSAHDLVFTSSLQAQASPCAANGGTVGGSAGICLGCSCDPSADR